MSFWNFERSRKLSGRGAASETQAGSDAAETRKKSAFRVFFLMLLGTLWLVCNSPFERKHPTVSLDASWEWVLSQKAAQQAQWGRDVVFTYGPYASLWTRKFGLEQAPLIIGLSFAIDLVMLLAIMRLLKGLPLRWKSLILFSSGLAFGQQPDVLFFMIPLLLVVISLGLPSGDLPQESAIDRRWVDTIIAALLSAICGLEILIKLSFAPLCILATILIDFQRMHDRRWPTFSPLLVISVLAFSSIAGQSSAALGAYFSTGLEIVGGYGVAMATHHADALSIADLGLWSGFILLSAVLAIRALSQKLALRERSLMIVFVLCFMAVLFKAAFVRNDQAHSWTAVTPLLLAALFVPASGKYARSISSLLTGVAISIVTIAVVYSCARVSAAIFRPIPDLEVAIGSSFSRRVEREPLIRNLLENAVDLPAALIDHRAWRVRQELADAEALAAIRRESGPEFPQVAGSVDVIPSRQAEVIALGMDYSPRPIFQEYSDYTPALIDLNRQYFAGTRAPQYLLWSPESIDDRWPSLAEGPLWPLILARYASVEAAGGMLVMRLRSHPCRVEPKLINELTEPFERVATNVPGGVFISIDLRPTWFGKLASLIYKPSAVYLVAQLRDGRIERRSLIPGIASGGFLLSPYVATVGALKRFAEGRPDSESEVVGWSLATTAAGRLEWSIFAPTRVYALDPPADCANGSLPA